MAKTPMNLDPAARTKSINERSRVMREIEKGTWVEAIPTPFYVASGYRCPHEDHFTFSRASYEKHFKNTHQ